MGGGVTAYDCMWIALDLLSLSTVQLEGEKVDYICMYIYVYI